MTKYIVKTAIGGGKTVITDTENVANFGSGFEGKRAFDLWLHALAQHTQDTAVDESNTWLGGNIASLNA